MGEVVTHFRSRRYRAFDFGQRGEAERRFVGRCLAECLGALGQVLVQGPVLLAEIAKAAL